METTGADGVPEADEEEKKENVVRVRRAPPCCSLCFYSSPSWSSVHRGATGNF